MTAILIGLDRRKDERDLMTEKGTSPFVAYFRLSLWKMVRPEGSNGISCGREEGLKLIADRGERVEDGGGSGLSHG